MSLVKKQVKIPERYEDRTECVICDICQKEVKEATTTYDGGIDWENGYDVNRTKITAGFGHSYPECCHIYWREYHICPECFIDKLEPFLKSLGANPTEKEEEHW